MHDFKEYNLLKWRKVRILKAYCGEFWYLEGNFWIFYSKKIVNCRKSVKLELAIKISNLQLQLNHTAHFGDLKQKNYLVGDFTKKLVSRMAIVHSSPLFQICMKNTSK